MKFPVLEKFVDLMKDLKCEKQSIYPLWGTVKLNFRDRYRKQIFFLRTPAALKFFTKLSKNDTKGHPVKDCHCTYTKPPMKLTRTVMM